MSESSTSSLDSLDDVMFPQLVRQVLVPLSSLPEKNVYAISHLLLRDQCTVPFLVRYRQRDMMSSDTAAEVTAPILFKLQQELENWTSLVKLRKSRLAALMKSEPQLDAGIVTRLTQCLTRAELDEAYDGVKPAAKATKVEAAKAVKGLEDVAKVLLNERNGCVDGHGNGASKIDTNELSALLKKHKLQRDDSIFRTHLQHYLADQVAHSATSVASAKQLMLHRVRVTTKEAKIRNTKVSTDKSSTADSSSKGGKSKLKKEDELKNIQNHQKYRDYFHFDRLLRGVPSHQVLALRRGKDAGALKMSLTVEERATAALQSQLRYQFQVSSKTDLHPSSLVQWRHSLMADVVMDAVQRLMTPMVTRLAWKQALEVADEEALGLFASNLRHLLLTPPLSQYLDSESSSARIEDTSSDAVVAVTAPPSHSVVVCGIDPGFAHGHKVVVLSFPLLVASAKPDVLCCTKLYTSSRSCVEKMAELLAQHKVQVVAIGNGTGSREAQGMTTKALELLLSSASPSSSTSSAAAAAALACRVAVVSEVGASVYSVCPLADKEYPEMDVAYRGAVSIAGRLVDPLREMVKVPPASLGLGMYQHDLKEAVLSRRLSEVLQEIVSEYGVDLNMASEEMLCYVSGLQRNRAKALIAHREKHGGFRSRDEVRTVKGIGETTFRNCAGFLRIYPPHNKLLGTGYNPLDATNVHPEKYICARVLLRSAWRQQHKNAKFNDDSIRQLLFSAELRSFLEGMSDVEWRNLFDACSEALVSPGADAPAMAVSEVKQLGAWLSSEEFCGDNYSVALSQDGQGVVGRGRGIRAKRGQPPLLTRVTTAGRQESTSIADISVCNVHCHKSESKKKKRNSDECNDTAEEKAEHSTSSQRKRLKSDSNGHQLDLEVGQERVGIVRNVTAFGVFLDIGASRDGLLHVSEFSSNKKKKGSKRSKGHHDQGDAAYPPLILGAAVRVAIKGIDTARDRISLTQID